MKARDIFNEDGRIVKGVNTTADVGPNEIKTQAAKFGNTVDKDGVPPTLSKKVKGASTNVAFNLGLTEGYKLQLERDKNTLVLHIKDTATGNRTEVRGKLGYETTGYDSNDPLHQLLDKIGKSANISELINGEVVTINPKHPEAEKAKAATDKAYGEDKDGVPPTLSKKVKGASTNVAFNLGLTEGFDPVGWLKSSLNPDPQYKAWKKVFKQNPAQAKKMFRSNHREYLAIYQNESISEKYNTENFADGKKPGRKGLAKRSGINTKASVSSLRKTAKRSSGEKQRMAHWLANMKAGKAKKK